MKERSKDLLFEQIPPSTSLHIEDPRSLKPSHFMDAAITKMGHVGRSTLLSARAKALYEDNYDPHALNCNLFNKKAAPTIIHRALHCSFLPLTAIRNRITSTLENIPGNLDHQWNTADDTSKSIIILGAHWTDESLHQSLLLDVSVSLLKTIEDLPPSPPLL
jgi:hypothetical protein